MIVVYLKAKDIEISKGDRADFIMPTQIGAEGILRVSGKNYTIYAEFLSKDVLGWNSNVGEEQCQP